MTDVRLKATVLIVDDEPGLRELLTRWVEADGYEPHTAVDAETALAAMPRVTPAVVLCDMALPGKDGAWLVQQLRADYPQVAVVLATANDEVPPMLSLRDGVVAYLVKPFQREGVRAAVRQGIAWHAARAGDAVPNSPASLDAWLDPTRGHE